MTTAECAVDGSATADGARLCNGCTDRLTAYLAGVPELVEELLVTRSKQDRIAEGGPRITGTTEKPLGFRPAAMESADLLYTTLAYWVCNVLGPEQFVLGFTGADSAIECSRILLGQIDRVRQHDDAGTFLSELGYACSKVRAAVDRPPGRTYAGPCDCGVDLYARTGSTAIVCRNCRTRFSMEARRAWLLESLRDHIATPAEIALGIGELHGQTINRKTINQWHSRGRLVPAGFTPGGDPMFRIGDVLELAVPKATANSDPE